MLKKASKNVLRSSMTYIPHFSTKFGGNLFLCDPAHQPTNRQTGRGENITSPNGGSN